MALWHICLVLVFSILVADAAVFTLQNNCNETIWPGILAASGRPLLNNDGLMLNPPEKATIYAPKGWSGRFWPRSRCNFDQFGTGRCATGDCGGLLQCVGNGGQPPASLAEFTLDSPMDYYDVSLVDGFNLPISIIPSGGSGNCAQVKCVADLNQICPRQLQVRSADSSKTIACKSACLAFQRPEYCCTGAYNNPNICKPTYYSQVFKRACPTSYSYPYDDATSTFTCQGAHYSIIFC